MKTSGPDKMNTKQRITSESNRRLRNNGRKLTGVVVSLFIVVLVVANIAWTTSDESAAPTSGHQLAASNLWLLIEESAVGVMLCTLLGIIVVLQRTSQKRAEALARKLTAEYEAARDRAERALRENEALQETIGKHSIVSITDPSGKIIFANDLFCAVSGYARDELMGQDHRILNSGVHPRQFWVDVWRRLTAGEPWHGEVCNRAKDGSQYWVDSIIAPFLDGTGKVQKYVSIRTDITERKKNETALRSSERRFRAVFDASPNPNALIDPVTMTIVDCNDAAASLLGYTRKQFLGLRMTDIDVMQSATDVGRISLSLANGKSVHYETRQRTKSGEIKDVIVSCQTVQIDDCELIFATWLDVTDRKKAEGVLHTRVIQSAFEADLGTVLARPLPFEEMLRRSMEAIIAHLGVSLARVWTVGGTPYALEFQAGAGLEIPVEDADRRVILGEGPIGKVAELKIPLSSEDSRDGAVFDVPEWARQADLPYFICYPLVADGKVVGVLTVYAPSAIASDTYQLLNNMAKLLAHTISRHVAEKALQRAARTDRLTGLPNRELLGERLRAAIERARQNTEARFAVLFLDFDRFKIINDSLGHDVGDDLLRQIAERLLSSLKVAQSLAGDAAGHTVARLGGDEFVVLLSDIDSSAEATVIAEYLIAVLSAPYLLGEQEVYSTASIGIVNSDILPESAEEVLRNADIAMYEAKRDGRARCAVFDESMHKRVRERHQLEVDLRGAVDGGHIRVYYQPIVDIGSGRIVSFEALARWQHPTRGIISPADFIPIAEETGLIVAIGQAVLVEATAFLERLSRLPGGEGISMNVNISRRQLFDSSFLPNLELVVRGLSVPPHCLRLEVTESAIMDRPDDVRTALNDVKALGVQLHMDDFGTGLSSLSLLRKLPLDGIKIDRAFIDAADGDRESIAILHAIISLGRNLRMSVTAEGIEKSEQFATVRALECDLVQGYAFGKPTPADEAVQVLARMHEVALPAEEAACSA